MSIIKSILMKMFKIPASFDWRAKSKTQAQAYIFQLPVEILLEIFKYLPPYSQLLVYQTCRPLRIIIHQYFLVEKKDILATLEDRLRYLTHLARSMPDRWVCAKCCKLHETYGEDTPIYRRRSDYQYPPCSDGLGLYSRHSACKNFFNHEYSPSHRHVELTLKYSRLLTQKAKHQKHFQKLLEPYHPKSPSSSGVSVTEGIRVQRSFYPKVVDGRYLLLTVRTYHGVETTISRQFLKFLHICPHLYSFGAFSTQNNMQIDLDMIFIRAFSALPNTLFLSSCKSCGTDISLQITSKRAILYAWQDFGPEGTVDDPDWGRLCGKLQKSITKPEVFGSYIADIITKMDLLDPLEKNPPVLTA